MNDFVATLVVSNDDFLIFDWRRPDTYNLSTRYILDKKRGTLIISGDSGDCIASWHHKTSAEEMWSYLHDIDYFMGKIETSSHKYTYEIEDAQEDLKELEDELVRMTEEDFEWSPEELREQFRDNHIDIWETDGSDSVRDMISEAMEPVYDFFNEYFEAGKHAGYNDDVTSLFEVFDCNWWENSYMTRIGERISNRIPMWCYGYRKGYDQLFGKKEEEK